MKINIYYGGRGLVEDPTVFVIDKMAEVLRDLRVEVTRYNLYEDIKAITPLHKTLKEADGVILATTVEWLGMGGYMQSFLDACWLYGDKEHISNLYMLPVVMASTYGERDTQLALIKAWELLGGIPCDGLCGYVDNNHVLENNKEYIRIIEKNAEYFYRTVSQKLATLPTSNNAVKESLLKTTSLNLTPQESEQLSMYVSDDTYVKKQKEDIKELTDMFKEMLWGDEDKDVDTEFIESLKKNFVPMQGFVASYAVRFTDKDNILAIEIDNGKLNCRYAELENPDVLVTTNRENFRKIISAKTTFQAAFMSGEITAKGNFNTLRMFDSLFKFNLILN